MKNRVLVVTLGKGEILKSNSESLDIVCANRENINDIVNEAIQGGDYDIIILSKTTEQKHINSILEMLSTNDVVCITARPKIGIISRIFRGIRKLLMKLLMPEISEYDYAYQLAVGFDARKVYPRFRLHGQYILHSVLLCLRDKEARVKICDVDEEIGSTGISSEISSILSLLGIGKETGELYRLIKFALVGVSGIFVNEFMLWYLTEYVGLFYLISSIFAIETSIISNFILNDLWTFQDRRSLAESPMFLRFLKYNVISWSTGSINWVVLAVLKEFFGVYYLIANIIGIFVAFIGNFILSSLWAWKIKY